MSKIFNRTSSRESDNSNVFGMPSKTRDDKEKKETEAQSTEEGQQTPEESKGESANQNVEEGEEVSSGQSEQQVGNTGEGPTNDEETQRQESNDKLAGKFEDRNSLLEGVKNLSDKLGRNVDPVKVQNTTTGELEEVYNELQSELGKTSDLDETREQNQQLKETLSKYEQQLNQAQQQMQQMQQRMQILQMQQQQPANNQQFQQQTPPNQMGQSQQTQMSQQQQADNSNRVKRDPNTGQFVSNRQQQNNQQGNQQQQDNQQQQIDPDKWLKKFYKDPVSAINEINELNQQQQQNIKQNMNQKQQQDFREQQKKMEQQREQFRRNYSARQKQSFNQQAEQLKQKYGEDFDNPETKKEVIRYMKNHRVYMNPTLFPNGMEIAYQNVKDKMNNNQQQQTNKQAENSDIKARKKAVNVSHSNSSNVRTNEGNEQEAEQIKEQIFGKGGGGMFGN